MIEVISHAWNKKGKFSGYIDGKKHLNKKQKLQSSLEGNKFMDKKGYILLILREDDVITDSDGTEIGYLKDSKIFQSERYVEVEDEVGSSKFLIPEELLCEIMKDKGVILDSKGSLILELKGNFDHLTNLDYFGIAGEFLEIFA